MGKRTRCGQSWQRWLTRALGRTRPNPSEELWQSAEKEEASPHPLPLLPSYPRKKRKGGGVLFPEPRHLAPSDEQRQQYISTLLEKTKSLYKALHFTENDLPQTQRNLTLQAVRIFFFHIHTYIYVHTHIYVCGRTCVYIV